MSDLRILIGERLRSTRKSKGLTQQNIADASDLDDSYIGAVERGERNFSIDILERILNALEIKLIDILHVQDNDERETQRQQAIEEYISITSSLSIENIQIMRNINKEIRKAFN